MTKLQEYGLDKLSFEELSNIAAEIDAEMEIDTALDEEGLTQAQCAELKRRLDEHLANPGAAKPWREVMARIEAKL